MRLIVVTIFLMCSQFIHAQWLKNLLFEENVNNRQDTFYFDAKTDRIQFKSVYTFKGYTSLPLFCKVEDKIEKKSQIPFKMRLGSLNYVDFLENKSKNNYFYGQY